MKALWTIIIILVLILVVGIYKSTCQMEFSKDKWSYKNDMEYSFRPRLYKDLIKNYKLIGLKYNELVDLLGLPESDYETGDSIVFYDIQTKYGYHIDPINCVTLKFYLTNDSIVNNYQINKYKKGNPSHHKNEE